MLHYLYHGSYVIDSTTLHPEIVNENNESRTNGRRSKWFSSPNFVDFDDTPIDTPAKTPKSIILLTNAMTAHAIVYVAAEHYELPDLKALCLKEFKLAKEDLNDTSLVNLSKVIYTNISSEDDPLRKELTRMLLADNYKLLNTGSFMAVLKEDPDTHKLCVDIAAALLYSTTKRSSKDKVVTEAQASASKQLLASLDQTNEALVKSTERIQQLESELAAAKAQYKELGSRAAASVAELQKGASTISSLQLDLEKANGKRNEAESLAKHLESANKKLEKDVKDSKDLVQKHVSITENRAKVKLDAINEKLKAETARADKNYNLCIERDAEIAKLEKTQIATDGDLARLINAESHRADKGKWIIRAIARLINQTSACNSCGRKLTWKLEVDDRIGQQLKEQPKMQMLKCLCGAKEYGANIK